VSFCFVVDGIAGGCKAFVRVGINDRDGIQQCLDQGADGIIVPYINTATEAREAVSAAMYPTAGTRSVYFPQRSMNKKGLLGYAGNSNKNVIIALQVQRGPCSVSALCCSGLPPGWFLIASLCMFTAVLS
jgi:2-keto-3-deoxy-L-rhamnonate aldolase RhmA